MRNEGDRRLGHVLEAGKLCQRDDQVPDDVRQSVVRRHRRKATKTRQTFFDQCVVHRGSKVDQKKSF